MPQFNLAKLNPAKSQDIAKKIFSLHNILYTVAKTFHEQTLSFAAEDQTEKRVNCCSMAPGFAESRDNRPHRTWWPRCFVCNWFCDLFCIQAFLPQACTDCSCGSDNFGNTFAGCHAVCCNDRCFATAGRP